MLTETPRTNAAALERADTRERHLAERQLSGPAGEHGDRHGADREAEHERVRELMVRARDHEGHNRGDRERAESDEAGKVSHPPDRLQLFGNGRNAGREGERLRAGVVAASHARDEHQTKMKRTNDDSPLTLPKLKKIRRYSTPIPIAPTNVHGKEVIRPTSAAVSPSSSVFGPIATISDECSAVAQSTTANTERNPAMLQIRLDTILGLMPESRARSTLVEQARTASPKRVRPSNTHSATTMSGTTRIVRSCDPSTRTLPTFQWLGDRRRELRPGDIAAPVAGQRGGDGLRELGDADGRDEHDDARCLREPPDNDQFHDRAGGGSDRERRDSASQYGILSFVTMMASSAAAGTPSSPAAKLMTRLDRYTSTMPIAITAMISPSTAPANNRFAVNTDASTD